ncbi:MAG TPA: CHAD domain-containing protein [Pseudonocardiaceae bacterium]|nr:CHAD domain-containing protein [Pseudonocardiaceae bacterium]
MTAAPTRPPRPLTAAVLRLAEQPLTADRDAGLAARFVATMDTQLRVLLDQQRRVGDLADPEAVHQMRVAIRRLRVALRVGTDTVGPAGDELRVELSWLAGELGTVRDLDVLAERLGAAADTLGTADADGVNQLLTALHDARVNTRTTLRAVLDADRYRVLLRALAKQIRTTVTDVPDVPEPTAVQPTDPLSLLDRPLRKLRRAVAAAGASASDEQLHILRIKGKRLRYAAELALGLCERRQRKPLRRLISSAKDLQEVLGDHHDTVTAETWLRESGTRLPGPAVLVAGRILERELTLRAAYEAEWPQAWQELDQRARALD